MVIGKRYFPELRLVAVSLRMLARPDYLLELVQLLSRRGVRMLSMIAQAHPDRPEVHALMFLDLTKCSLEPSGLLDEIGGVSNVVEARMVEMPFTYGEARIVAFALGELHLFFEEVAKTWGTAGEAILYHLGLRAGRAFAEKLIKHYGTGIKLLNYILAYSSGTGYGRFEVVSYSEGKRAIIRAYELFECYGRRSDKPTSHLFRGILAGIFSAIWSRNVTVTEVRCVAVGDEHCEFLIEGE